MFSNSYELDQRISSFMAGVYGWMSCALAITAGTAYYVASNAMIFMYLRTHSGIIWGLLLAQLALVFGINLLIKRISFITALIFFFLYAISVGITLSWIFYIFIEGSIISAFLTTAGMFGMMSFYGYVTKADLTSVGNMCFMAVIGLIIGLITNRFLQNEQFDYILSGIGVIIFVLLTASDTQKIKQIGRHMLGDQEMVGKVTLIGALALYLDFLNLFLFLLRFMGNRRDQ